MDKIIVEVGSTCTKVDRYNGEKIEKLEGNTIQLKKHYNENKKLKEEVNEYFEDNNVEELVDIVELIYAILNAKNVEIEEFEI